MKMLHVLVFLAAWLPGYMARAADIPAGFKSVTLLETEDDFRSRWIKRTGTVSYDGKRKGAEVESNGGDLGGFRYYGPWQELNFNLVITSLTESSKHGFEISVGNAEGKDHMRNLTFDFGPIIKKPGTYRVNLTMDGGRKVALKVNGEAVRAPALAEDAELLTPLEIVFNTPLRRSSAFIEQVKVTGKAEEVGRIRKEEGAGEAEKGGIGKVFVLLSDEADFLKRWTKRDGTSEFNAGSKIISWKPGKGLPLICGRFTYRAKWEEFEFDVVLSPSSLPKVDKPYLQISLGYVSGYPSRAQEIELINPASGKPGKYHVKVVFENRRNLKVYVDGKTLRSPLAVLDPQTMDPLVVDFASGRNPIEIGNVKVKGEAE